LDVGQAVGFTLVGNLVVAGYSTSGDFPTTSGSYQPVYTAGLTPQPFTNSPCVQIAASCPPGDFYRFPASGFITGYEKLELRAETTAVTLKAGESRALTLSVFPRIGDKTTSVQLSCSGLPNGSSCEFSPSQLMPGTEPTPVSLTIKTTSTATARVVAPHGPGLAWLLALTVAPGFLVSCWRRTLTRRPRAGMLLVVMMSLALLNLGCGSSGRATTAQQSGAGTIAGTYQVTVRAVWGTTESSTGITLTVQ
jgi:hypothetical protein